MYSSGDLLWFLEINENYKIADLLDSDQSSYK